MFIYNIGNENNINNLQVLMDNENVVHIRYRILLRKKNKTTNFGDKRVEVKRILLNQEVQIQ